MSTNSTILLSNENEHWYEDLADKEMILEFSSSHELVKESNGDFFVVIKKGSPLYESIREEFKKGKIR